VIQALSFAMTAIQDTTAMQKEQLNQQANALKAITAPLAQPHPRQEETIWATFAQSGFTVPRVALGTSNVLTA
jgi:hypothetical protein